MMDWGDGAIDVPDPDGAIGAGDRLHLLDLYAGIAASPPVALTPITKTRRTGAILRAMGG